MNKLIHPATEFAQKLTYTEVQFKDMTPQQQAAIWSYMWFQTGIWKKAGVYVMSSARKRFADVRFGVGKFANDTELKIAIATSHPDRDEDEGPLDYYEREANYCKHADHARAIPVILNHEECVAEFGLFEWGYEYFWAYWCKQPETEFVRFLPDWDDADPTGRGGQ